MNITKKYLEALKEINDWVIVSDWARKVGELYPDLLDKANQEAEHQLRDTTGLREIAARISSAIVRGAYIDNIEIDESDKPRKIRYVSAAEHEQHVQQEIEDDVAPLKRGEIIQKAESNLSEYELYRIEELNAISKMLKKFFQLDFEVDHANALLSKAGAGQHHPDNLQLLLKAHNSKKNNNNWSRFSVDEQVEYILVATKLQAIIAPRMALVCDDSVLDGLLDRLKVVY